jgi:hypothetical protein
MISDRDLSDCGGLGVVGGLKVRRLLFSVLAATVLAICGAFLITDGAGVAQTGSCSFGPDSVISGTWSGEDVAGFFVLAQNANVITGSQNVQGTVYQVTGSCPSAAHLILQIHRPIEDQYSNCQGFDDLKDRPWVLNLLETPDGQELDGVLAQSVEDSTGLGCVVSWKSRHVTLKRQTNTPSP